MLGTGNLLLSLNSLGTYGQVWNCVQRETGASRAVKVIKKDKTKRIQMEEVETSSDPMNEISLLCKLDHPNIVRVHETFEDEQNYYIVLE